MRVRTRAYLPHAFAEDQIQDWEEDLFTVFNGGNLNDARVGRIPHFLARSIGASTTIVRLSKQTAKKVRGKHREIHFADLREVATAFHQGDVARQGKMHLAFWFQSPVNPKRTILAILKATNQGHEIWLKTLYPIAKHRLKAYRAKVMILREAES
jgi:hypothetical protein